MYPVSPLLIPIVSVICSFSFAAVVTWLATRRKERESYYRHETLKKLAEGQGGGASAIEFIREQERISARHRREGQKLGGLITAAVGVGMMVFLKAIGATDSDPAAHQVYLVGLIPLMIGVVLLTYSFLLAPKDQA